MVEAILELRGVTKRFAFDATAVTALAEAGLRVEKGEFVCLIGPSGCGKSTLLRLVAGFETASEGEVLMWTKPVRGPGPDRGMVFQDYGLFPWLTVKQNIGFGPAARGLSRPEVKDISERFVEMVGLTRFADAYPHQLSGGMKQRVAIARVLANDAEIVLMDEPFGALDAMTRAALQGELTRIWTETRKTILFITHDIEEAVALATRVAVMTRGPGGTLKAVIPVDLPYPRDRTSDGFMQVFRAVHAQIHAEIHGA